MDDQKCDFILSTALSCTAVGSASTNNMMIVNLVLMPSVILNAHVYSTWRRRGGAHGPQQHALLVVR